MPAPRPWYRCSKRLALTLGLCLGLGTLTCWYLWQQYHAPTASEGPLTVIYFPPGTGVQQMATQLHHAGLIRQRHLFLFYTMFLRVTARLQAGEYALRATMSPAQIIATLSHGRVMHHALTIPEGATLRDIARLTEAKGLGTQSEILSRAQDTSFVASRGLTVSSLEGYLFPETYHIPRGITAQALLTMMVAQVTGLVPGDFVHTFGDAYLYDNHVEQALLQLSREPRRLPTMLIDATVGSIFNFEFEHFRLENYDPHPHIPAPVAV